MKVLIFITICLTLFTLVQSIEENDENQLLTVYKTVTAPANTDKLQTPTASSASEQVKPTVSSEAEDEPAALSTLEETPVNGEKSIDLNDDKTLSPTPDTEVEVETEEEEEEEKDTNKPMKMAPEVSSEKDGASDKESSLVSEGSSKSALSGSASASAPSSSSTKSYNSAFSFSPITLAPESTKAAGAKATAPVMNKASAKTGTVKTDKHASSGFKVTPSISFILFVLALIS